MAEDIAEGTISLPGRGPGIHPAGYQDWVTARPSDDNEQQLFGLPRDAAMFVIYRTAFTEDGTATQVAVSRSSPPTGISFFYSYGAVPKGASATAG